MRALLVATMVAHLTAAAMAQVQPEPSAQFQKLLKTFNSAGGAFRATETDRQRMEAVRRFADYPQKFLRLMDRANGRNLPQQRESGFKRQEPLPYRAAPRQQQPNRGSGAEHGRRC